MMGVFKKLFQEKNKKTVFYLFVLCGAGILFIALSLIYKKPEGAAGESEAGKLFQMNNEAGVYETSSNEILEEEYGAMIEKKLQDILSCVEGAGNVKVMVTLLQSEEIIIAGDKTTDKSGTTETDSEGGSREVYSYKETDKILLVKTKDGNETPIILTELYPKIKGVLIVAQGGGDILIKDALIRAVQTVLGIEAHRVQVLKMK